MPKNWRVQHVFWKLLEPCYNVNDRLEYKATQKARSEGGREKDEKGTMQLADKALLKICQKEGSLAVFARPGCSPHSVNVLIPV